jgi:hypothetical protein
MPTIWVSATSSHWPGANSVEAVNIIRITHTKMVGFWMVALSISPGVTGASVEALTGGSFSRKASAPKITHSTASGTMFQRQGNPAWSIARPKSAPPTRPAGYQACRMPSRPTRSSG